MGELGEYWRDHKEYKRDRKLADSLGISVAKFRKEMSADSRREKAAKKAARLAMHTIKCECGKTFMDKNAHNCHKSSLGRLGHRGTVIEPAYKHPETLRDDCDNWAIF